MEASLYAKMLSDKSLTDLKKMQYKYTAAAVAEMLVLLNQTAYKTMPLFDFNGKELVYLENYAQISMSASKALLIANKSNAEYGLKAMEDEIHSTLNIENIRSSRESIHRILCGYAPKDEAENRIFGMKNGLDFISDTSNEINEENIFKLYMLTVGNYLEGEDKLLPGQLYRHDSVFVVGDKVEHQGLISKQLPEYMAHLVSFIKHERKMNDLLKAAVIHFYIAYLHPYFDGNGRMARLLHLWYLVRQGYSATLFFAFSSYINKSKSKYYKAFTLVEENFEISGLIDVTPFLLYYIENVYNLLEDTTPQADTMDIYKQALALGNITEKEKSLFLFVCSAYGENMFSTKQLERDFGNAAYATIRSFVLKFESLGILKSEKHSNRVKYSLN
jgi:Fic family protein